MNDLLTSWAVPLGAAVLVGLCAVILDRLLRDVEFKLPHDPVGDITQRIIWRKRR